MARPAHSQHPVGDYAGEMGDGVVVLIRTDSDTLSYMYSICHVSPATSSRHDRGAVIA